MRFGLTKKLNLLLLLVVGVVQTSCWNNGDTKTMILSREIDHGFRVATNYEAEAIIGRWEGVDLSSMYSVSLSIESNGTGNVRIRSLTNPTGYSGPEYSNLVAALSALDVSLGAKEVVDKRPHGYLTWEKEDNVIRIIENGGYGWIYVHEDVDRNKNRARAIMLKRHYPYGWAIMLRDDVWPGPRVSTAQKRGQSCE